MRPLRACFWDCESGSAGVPPAGGNAERLLGKNGVDCNLAEQVLGAPLADIPLCDLARPGATVIDGQWFAQARLDCDGTTRGLPRVEGEGHTPGRTGWNSLALGSSRGDEALTSTRNI